MLADIDWLLVVRSGKERKKERKKEREMGFRKRLGLWPLVAVGLAGMSSWRLAALRLNRLVASCHRIRSYLPERVFILSPSSTGPLPFHLATQLLSPFDWGRKGITGNAVVERTGAVHCALSGGQTKSLWRKFCFWMLREGGKYMRVPWICVRNVYEH
jgi:hypothetical protein